MKTVLTVLALVTVVACGKKVEVVADAGVVAEPAKIEAVKEEVKPATPSVETTVVVGQPVEGTAAPAAVAPEAGVPASPVK